MRILVNDGIELSGKIMLEQAGFDVDMNKIPQEELVTKLNNFDVICVRSATKVRKEQIDAAPNLKIIARGGVGLDNIDVEYAKSKGIHVINTPGASSRSVAELAIAHIAGLARFLNKSNQTMPTQGSTAFNELKKQYSGGLELEGKILGVIGMGRIGQETIKLGIGHGMDVMAYDPFVDIVEVVVGNSKFNMKAKIERTTIDHLLSKADFVSIHVPGLDKPVLGKDEFAKMKKGVIVVNAARGGVIDEDALLEALNSGQVAAAGIDVFIDEPTPRPDLLSHKNVSLSPHIGAATLEAQEKVGGELAGQIIALLKGQ